MTAFSGSRLAFGLAALACAAFAAPAQAVIRQEMTVNGFKVWRFAWNDSKGLLRTVSLKKQGEGNAGNGGYAIQMTYRHVVNGVVKNVVANAANGEGFGYFVAHERERLFVDDTEASISFKIDGDPDDSPLGRKFPVTTRLVPTGANKAAIVFKQTYPKWGTIAASGFNLNTGKDDPKLSLNAADYNKYQLPVTLTWYFQDGRDYPRIVTKVDMASVPGPNRVSFDVRGPYGKLDFDVGNNPMRQVVWGDRFHFKTTVAPLTNQSSWVWNQPNTGARYTSLIAGGAEEMGILEPVLYTKSAINDGYSDGRGKTSATYDCGAVKLPCDGEWPYQSSQYELQGNSPTTSEKIAWGSVSFFGMNTGSTYDGGQSVPFDGFPARKFISYHTCVVLGQLVSGGLTRTTAIRGGTYNCADTKLD